MPLDIKRQDMYLPYYNFWESAFPSFKDRYFTPPTLISQYLLNLFLNKFVLKMKISSIIEFAHAKFINKNHNSPCALQGKLWIIIYKLSMGYLFTDDPYHPKCYLVFEKDLSLVKTSSTGSSESMLNETLSSFSCTAFHISNGRKVNLLLDMSRVDKDLREKMEGGMYSRRLSCSWISSSQGHLNKSFFYVFLQGWCKYSEDLNNEQTSE